MMRPSLALPTYPSSKRTHGMLQVILNSNFQAGLVAR